MGKCLLNSLVKHNICLRFVAIKIRWPWDLSLFTQHTGVGCFFLPNLVALTFWVCSHTKVGRLFMLPNLVAFTRDLKLLTALRIPGTHGPWSLWVPEHWEWVPSLMFLITGNFKMHHQDAGPRLNIKTVLSMYGDFHVKDKTAVRTSYL